MARLWAEGVLSAIAALSLYASAAAETPRPLTAASPQRLAIPIAATRSGAGPAPSVECVVTFGPPTAVSALAFSPDGQTLAVGGHQEVLLWDLAAARLAKRIGAGQLAGPVRALAYLDDGRSLAVGEGTPDPSGAVKVFAVQTGQVTAALKEPAEAVYCLAVSPDGQFLAAAGADAKVHIWSAKDKKLAATINDHADWVLAAAFSPDGKLLATAGADKTLMIWEVGTWTRAAAYREAEALHGAAIKPDGTLLVAVGGPNEWAVRARRKDDPKRSRPTYTGGGMPLGITCVAKTERTYVPCSDKTVKVFQATGTTPVATLRGHADWVYAVAASPDGARLASGSADGTVRLWNAPDGRPLATLVQLAPRTDQWLIITAPGYLATSSAGALRWRAEGLATAPENLTVLLDSAESVQKILAGKEVAPPALK